MIAGQQITQFRVILLIQPNPNLKNCIFLDPPYLSGVILWFCCASSEHSKWVFACLCGCKNVYLSQLHMVCVSVCMSGSVCVTDVSNLIVVTPICLPRLSSFRMGRVGIRRFWHSRLGWHAPILKHGCHSLPLTLPLSVCICHTYICTAPTYTYMKAHQRCPIYRTVAALIATQE